jgi:hypothetical protein
LETKDWLWVLHPALAVAVVYPLIGMVARLGLQTRERRVGGAKLPPSTGREHSDLGRWLALAVVASVLVALTVVIATATPWEQFRGGAGRAIQLLLVLAGSAAALAALWWAHAKGLRLAFSLITWLGVLTLGAQTSGAPTTGSGWRWWGSCCFPLAPSRRFCGNLGGGAST